MSCNLLTTGCCEPVRNPYTPSGAAALLLRVHDGWVLYSGHVHVHHSVLHGCENHVVNGAREHWEFELDA